MQHPAAAVRQRGVVLAGRELMVGDTDTSLPAGRLAVEEVHARHGQQLWGFARRLGLSDHEAEDAVQEALLRLWRALGEGSQIDQPAAWTFRTTYRLAMDRHRLRRRWQAFLDRHGPSSTEAAAQSDDLFAVWSEVDRLPERQRQVLYLRFRADLTFEAIGEVLGIGASSARSNASRGLATLRARLGDEER